MEYGEAINSEALERAVSIARELVRKDPRPLPSIAAEAVSRAFCVCVVEGEDAAEDRLSDVHRSLIEAVIWRTETAEAPAMNRHVSPASGEDRPWL